MINAFPVATEARPGSDAVYMANEAGESYFGSAAVQNMVTEQQHEVRNLNVGIVSGLAGSQWGSS